MIKGEKLDKYTYVLISTSVLDNGVNLWDIKNIVVSDAQKVKCLQMVGRARVEKDDKGIERNKTLYIRRFDEGYISKRIESLESQKAAYYSFNLAYDPPTNEEYKKGYSEYVFLNKYYNDEYGDWNNAKHWFGRDKENPTNLFPDLFALELADIHLATYEAILNEMRRAGEDHEVDDEGQMLPGQRYLEYQLSWFGKKYDEGNDITSVGKGKAEEELVNFLESYAIAGKQMFKGKEGEENEQDKFSKEFTRLCDEAFGEQDPNKGREYGIAKINKILRDHNLDYLLDSGRSTDAGKPTYWIVVRLDREADKPVL